MSVYPPLGSSTGPLNEAPTATISGPQTELVEPQFSPSSRLPRRHRRRPRLRLAATPTADGYCNRDRCARATATHATPPQPRPATPQQRRRPQPPPATPTATATATADTHANTDRNRYADHYAERGPGEAQLRQRRCDRDQQAQEGGAHQQGHDRGGDRIGDRDAAIRDRRRQNTCSGQTIAPKKKCSFEVEFAPATRRRDRQIDRGAYNGASPAMSLSGAGIAVTLKAPKSESFTAVDAGAVGKAKSIELSNPSTVPVTLETAALGAPDPGSFTIASDGCSGQLLASKSKCTVAVKFAPPGTASGTQTSTLSFGFTYGANNGSVSIALKSKVK